VHTVDRNASDKPVVVAEGHGRNHVETFDLVIMAVGFGLERTLPGLPLLSYWENDNYGRPILTGSVPRTYLVTGCGDGGLIDAIRLRINAFDHANFVYSLQRLPDIEPIKARLLDIDREVRDETVYVRPDLKEESQGVLLERKYRQLDIPTSLKELLTSQLRLDTIVYLNSPQRTPYSLKASILNRFLVFLLRDSGGIWYRSGKVAVTVNTPPHGFGVVCRHLEFPDEHFHVDEIVVRHGPIAVIDRLFPKTIADACRGDADDVDDPTRQAMYPTEFLARQDLLERKRQVALDFALSNAALAAKGRFRPELHNRFGVEVRPDEKPPVRYSMRARSPRDGPMPVGSFYELSVVEEPIDSASVADMGGKVPEINPTDRPGEIQLGMGIDVGVPPRYLSRGTLCCFVRFGNPGGIAILTAGSLFTKHAKIYRAGDAGGVPIARVTRVRRAVASPPRATLGASNVVFNEIDAGLAMLSSDVPLDFRLPIKTQEPVFPKLADAEPESRILGRLVFKMGSGSGLTRGTVTQIGVAVNTGGSDAGSVWYRDMYCVEGVGGASFSAPGDAGALVFCEDGTALGMVHFGNGQQTYVSPLGRTLAALECELVSGPDR
jgi:hypothetical protein